MHCPDADLHVRMRTSSCRHELLLQSDARDALSMRETSPFLISDRLQLRNTSSTTYVNGGVFFARGTHAVARVFEDAWALVSQDLGVLNEQDCTCTRAWVYPQP